MTSKNNVEEFIDFLSFLQLWNKTQNLKYLVDLKSKCQHNFKKGISVWPLYLIWWGQKFTVQTVIGCFAKNSSQHKWCLWVLGWNGSWEHDVPQSRSSPEQVIIQCRQKGIAWSISDSFIHTGCHTSCSCSAWGLLHFAPRTTCESHSFQFVCIFTKDVRAMNCFLSALVNPFCTGIK